MKQFSDDGDKAQIAVGFGEVGMIYRRLMLLMSYKYISSSKTTARRFRFSRTARTADGNVSSHMTDALWFVELCCEQVLYAYPPKRKKNKYDQYLRVLNDQVPG